MKPPLRVRKSPALAFEGDFRVNGRVDADVQLRILQILPAIFQNYGDDLKGDLVSKSLLICSNLQASKVGVVHSTAAATFQQLAVAVFDRIVVEDGTFLRSQHRLS